MAKKEGTSLGFKLVSVLTSLVVIAGIFSLAFSQSGNQVRGIINAAIPVGSGIIAAGVLGAISKLSNKRWTIYLVVLLVVALFIVLRLFRVL